MPIRSSVLLVTSALSWLSPSALAQSRPAAEDGGPIIVTAARTILPANALPLTVDVIDQETLNQQVAIGGSIVDAVSALTPSFSPTRQKLSGAGETLRGRSPKLRRAARFASWMICLSDLDRYPPAPILKQRTLQ